MRLKKTWISSCVVLILIACLVLLSGCSKPEEKGPAQPDNQEEIASPSAVQSPMEEPKEPYKSPIDFEELWKTSKDMYAWLEIPGMDVSYPILQHQSKDAWYLDHNRKGKYDLAGELFTEASYNNREFTDPLTIVYGHRLKDGTMFGTLQKTYSVQENIGKYPEIIVYMPERELHFKVFAAVPYDNRHILYNYDFSNKRTFRLFFDQILSIRAMEAAFAEDEGVTAEDQVLLLSTCLIGNRSKRFIVCGKLTEIIE